MANIFPIAVTGFTIIIIANIVGGLFYLGVIWFSANRRWPWPLNWYLNWLNRKTHNIKAKAEAKELSDEWREMNDGNWKRGKKFEA